jgi:hypothetical protein
VSLRRKIIVGATCKFDHQLLHVSIGRVLQQSVRLPKKRLHYFEEAVAEQVLSFVTASLNCTVGYKLKYWDSFNFLKEGRA